MSNIHRNNSRHRPRMPLSIRSVEGIIPPDETLEKNNDPTKFFALSVPFVPNDQRDLLSFVSASAQCITEELKALLAFPFEFQCTTRTAKFFHFHGRFNNMCAFIHVHWLPAKFSPCKCCDLNKKRQIQPIIWLHCHQPKRKKNARRCAGKGLTTNEI